MVETTCVQWLSEFHNFLCFSCIHSLCRLSSNIGKITLFVFPVTSIVKEKIIPTVLYIFVYNQSCKKLLKKWNWSRHIETFSIQSSLKTHATSKYLKRRCNSKCFSNVEVRSRNKSFSWIHLVAQSSKQWYKFWLFFLKKKKKLV